MKIWRKSDVSNSYWWEGAKEGTCVIDKKWFWCVHGSRHPTLPCCGGGSQSHNQNCPKGRDQTRHFSKYVSSAQSSETKREVHLVCWSWNNARSIRPAATAQKPCECFSTLQVSTTPCGHRAGKNVRISRKIFMRTYRWRFHEELHWARDSLAFITVFSSSTLCNKIWHEMLDVSTDVCMSRTFDISVNFQAILNACITYSVM